MMAKSFTLPSFAKINLFLRILGKRSDNYHELCTAFQTISLGDKLTFQESVELRLTCNDKNVPINDENLIIKAGKLLFEKTNKTIVGKIHLEKNIPFPGGLGGGSSNAATALLGLSTLCDLQISFEELCEIGSEIGADVPFFLYGGTALGTGRGTEIKPLKNFDGNCLLIITPNIEISTVEAYRRINAQDLTNIDSKSILKICRDEANWLESGHLNFVNDFEESVFKIEPEIKRIKEKLLESGAKTALLSGSGASVFAIFDNEETQQVAFNAFENEANMRKFAVKTISRQEYQNSLDPCKHLLPKSF